MSLIAIIKDAQMQARKSKDVDTLSTLQIILSYLKNEEIEKQTELTDDEVVAVLRRFVKQTKDAQADFEQAGRQDLVDKTRAELDVVSQYLPQLLDESEVKRIATSVMQSYGSVTQKDFGKVMREVMKEINGRADGQLVQSVVRQLID
jgi:uncharacterized protein YqeY